MFKSIWVYREFILSCIKREFQAKYKGSALGTIWSIIEPLTMIFVYTVIFSEIMRAKLAGVESDKLAYGIYLCAGILTWGLFAETVNACINVFLSNGNLMKKISFPRICLPVISAGSAFINFCISYGLFFIALFLLGRFPWETVIFIIPYLVAQTFFAISFGLGLGVLNVFFRDVGKLFNVLLQFWFWFTPVVYPASIIPEDFIGMVELNPMAIIVSGYQDIMVFNKIPDMLGLFEVIGVSMVLVVWSYFLYKKHVGEMVDEL